MVLTAESNIRQFGRNLGSPWTSTPATARWSGQCPIVGYSEDMSIGSIPADTSPSAWAVVLERFASMTVGERANAAQELNDLCTAMAIAGIRHYHDDVNEDDLRWHLAARRYGKSLADEVYGSRLG